MSYKCPIPPGYESHPFNKSLEEMDAKYKWSNLIDRWPNMYIGGEYEGKWVSMNHCKNKKVLKSDEVPIYGRKDMIKIKMINR